jgi:hypothetical protein
MVRFNVKTFRVPFASIVFACAIAMAVSLLAQERIFQLGGGSTSNKPPPAGPVPRLPDGTVDLSGAWQGGGPVQDMERQGELQEGLKEIPLLPGAKKLMESRQRENDPHTACLPMGVPRMAGGYPWRFVQFPTHKKATHIFLLYEANIHSYRQIFMDGRKHPPDPDPTWFGHSIGSWQGDTLVIDTVGFNDKFWFDARGHPHTEQLHTVERWTRIDLGHLVNEITIDDPGAYSRPFTMKFTATLRPGEELMEYICQENNQSWGRPTPQR